MVHAHLMREKVEADVCQAENLHDYERLWLVERAGQIED